MVTKSVGSFSPAFYDAGMFGERGNAPARATPSRGSRDTPTFEAAGSGVRSSPVGRTEQIIELVVAAVTIVADIVTLALARSDKRETPSPKKPVHLPGVGRPVGVGSPTTPIQSPITGTPPRSVPGKRLDAIRSDTGDITVRTYDGYVVRVEALKGGWSISDPDGKTTQVSAHGQVRESDGGSWTLRERGSFEFGSHKVTVHVPSGKKSSSTASKLTIYSGNERVTIGGLNSDRPILDAVAGDGVPHDDGVDDGTTYLRGKTKFGESWSVVSGGKRRVMGAS